jgi:inner membrane protein
MDAVQHWQWLAIGGLLAIAEMVVPGFFLIWLAGAAVATGLIAMILPIGVSLQIATFAALSVAIVYAARRWIIANPIVSADPLLNDRSGRLVGQVVTVVQAIDAAGGRVKVGDSVWSARGQAAAVGANVRIVAAESSVLVVEAVAE